MRKIPLLLTALLGFNNTAFSQTMEETAMPTKIQIQVNKQTFAATLEDNATNRALIKKMPFTVKMENKYERELVSRQGAGWLPDSQLRHDNFAVGDLVYWQPRGSLVILYKQDGDRFERQHLGHIEQDVSDLGTQSVIEATFRLQ